MARLVNLQIYYVFINVPEVQKRWYELIEKRLTL